MLQPYESDLSVKVADDLITEKSPLSFDHVPGPAILKLWYKYWKYVPLFGNLWNRNSTPLQYLFNRYGPIVRLGGPLLNDIVLIHRPEHISKVFDEEGEMPTRSGIDILQHYRLNHRQYRFSGPFCTQGQESLKWLETKKSLRAPIAEQLKNQFRKLDKSCNEFVSRIRQIKNRQDEVPDNFNSELARWGMECFWILMINKQIGFLDSAGYEENSEPTKFIKALMNAQLYLSRCENGFQFWRFMETPSSKKLFDACDVIDGIIRKYIRFAQTSQQHDSALKLENKNYINSTILETMLIKQNMNPNEASTLLMDMVILGVLATTNSLSFLLYYLSKNPRVQRNLHHEIISKTASDLILEKKTFDEMPYLNACMKECLRLRPPFPYLTRLLSKSISLHGYTIPKGTYLIMANQLSSQREENFEDSEKFRPERWMTDNVCHPKNSYLPFGKGLRSCIGEDMAKIEMMLLITKILLEYRIEYDYGDIHSNMLMMNVPSKPLRFRFIERDECRN
uniref:Cytochrome P450 n=1 Tax=Trichogramma kaykai TaxID=54128 RepID=A0ABD2X7C4_9HYME